MDNERDIEQLVIVVNPLTKKVAGFITDEEKQIDGFSIHVNGVLLRSNVSRETVLDNLTEVWLQHTS